MNASIEKWQKLLDQNPGNELARFSLAKAFYDAGRFGEAREHFAIALSKKPDWMVAQILLGKSELALGNRTAAMEDFKKARDLAQAQNHEGPLAEMEELLATLNASE